MSSPPSDNRPDTPPPDTPPLTRGFPLAALFVIVTASAVLIAPIAPVMRDLSAGKRDGESLLVALLIGGVVGALLGAIWGAIQFQRWHGLPLGGLIGAPVGVIAGLMFLISPQEIASVALAMIAGSAIIVILAVVLRKREIDR